MKDYKYTEKELLRNKILKYQDDRLNNISFDDSLEDNIKSSENLIESLGYGESLKEIKESLSKKQGSNVRYVKLPEFEEIKKEANSKINGNVSLESIFTSEELNANENYIIKLNNEYNQIHKLDKIDISICVVAGIISAVVDILLVGIPKKTHEGLKAGRLSDYIRHYFEEKYPPEEMERLGGKLNYKTPYDAQDNRNTTQYVEGLSTYYHRLLQLGHDPILGFVIGVSDIMTGKMTTIDKQGKIVIQKMGCYTGRTESYLFEAISRQLRYLKSDFTTSMGLPAPFMSLFNLLQFGSIGDEKQTIAQIVQGMYYEGYDFIHFCSTAIPVMITETIVRLSYAVKRIKEGHSIADSIPVSTNRTKHPKLGTMLFVAHSISTGINAGKIYFTKNPMSINYAQWITFALYTFKQLKWNLIEKPYLRDKYVHDKIDEELIKITQEIGSYYYKFE